ncbi:MAG: TetR/AcrR family transcriptional regulator [Acidimicrobiales bacterium]
MYKVSNVARARRYDNSRRAQAAEATRRRVVDAAGECFREAGYAATTLGAIASRADVSVETVTKTFGTKRALLRTWFDACVAGPEAVPVASASWLSELEQQPGFDERVDLFAAWLTEVFGRVAPAVSVMTAAAHADRVIAEMWAEERRRRFSDVTVIAPLVLGDQVPSMSSDELVDTMYALSEVHLYLVLVEERRWSPARYRDWFATGVKQLIAGSPCADPLTPTQEKP